MGKPILKTDIVRDPTKLYYCATDERGCILVCEAILSRGGKKKKVKK